MNKYNSINSRNKPSRTLRIQFKVESNKELTEKEIQFLQNLNISIIDVVEKRALTLKNRKQGFYREYFFSYPNAHFTPIYVDAQKVHTYRSAIDNSVRFRALNSISKPNEKESIVLLVLRDSPSQHELLEIPRALLDYRLEGNITDVRFLLEHSEETCIVKKEENINQTSNIYIAMRIPRALLTELRGNRRDITVMINCNYANGHVQKQAHPTDYIRMRGLYTVCDGTAFVKPFYRFNKDIQSLIVKYPSAAWLLKKMDHSVSRHFLKFKDGKTVRVFAENIDNALTIATMEKNLPIYHPNDIDIVLTTEGKEI